MLKWIYDHKQLSVAERKKMKWLAKHEAALMERWKNTGVLDWLQEAIPV